MKVAVKVSVAVKVAVGFVVSENALAGVEVIDSTKNSKGCESKISAAAMISVLIMSAETISGDVSRMPTRLLMGPFKVSAKNDDSSAALLSSVSAITMITAAASSIWY